jgi:hypothetical protein
VSKRAAVVSLSWLWAVNVLAGTELDGADVAYCKSEAVANWLRDDPDFIARLNRAKSFRRERLPADVPPSVRLRASLAVLQAADTLKVEEIGTTTAEAVQAKIDRKRFIDSLGG